MARPRKKKEDISGDEENHLEIESEESEIQSEESIAAEDPKENLEQPALAKKESKKISGSPLGKVRGKDLKNY